MGGGAVGASRWYARLERRWDTATMPEADQFAFWREVAWEQFVPVSLERRGEGPFPSSVSVRPVGHIGVLRIASQAQTVTRTPAHIKRRGGDVFFLNMPLCDGSSAGQDGRTAQLRRGDFVLVDSEQPFHLAFERDFKQVSLMLPYEALSPYLAAPRKATAVCVRGSRGVGAVASSAIRALARDRSSLDSHAARAISTQIAALVALAVGGMTPQRASAGRVMLLQAALDEIERRLDDPDLCPDTVAARLSISVRYLHVLFADHGCSFCRWVLQRRLERCHLDLVDPSRAHWTIASIACSHGFRDPSYFARAFNARYGVTPRGLRVCEGAPAQGSGPILVQ